MSEFEKLNREVKRGVEEFVKGGSSWRALKAIRDREALMNSRFHRPSRDEQREGTA